MGTDPNRSTAPPGYETSPGAEDLLEQLRRITLGEYDVAGELGRGGMATVYLAHDLSLHRKVAIKVMLPALHHGPGMAERFKREARTAAALSHPNIIPIYSVREAEGLLFFVMKLIQGTPLDAVIKELGPLPIPIVEALLGQIGGALGYAHRQGVVHRDVKPGNILIDDEGWAVVSDFGIAKVAEAEGLTVTGMAVGTPSYMAPEQCQGGEIDGASDQYALGCVAFEMLTGRPPFTAPTQMALMYSHCHEPPPPVETLRPDCPVGLRDAVARMLSKSPEDRWPSLEDAVAAIGIRTLSHDDPTRHQLVTLAKTGVVHRLVSAVQTPRSPVPLTKARPGLAPPGAPKTPARDWRRWVVPATAAAVLAIVGVATVLTRGGGPGDTALSPEDPPATAAALGGNDTTSAAPGVAEAAIGSSLPPPTPSVRRAAPPPARQAIRDSVTAPVPEARGSDTARQSEVEQRPVAVPPPAARPAAPVVAESTRAVPPPPPVPPPATVSVEQVLAGVLQRYTAAMEAGAVGQALAVFPDMPADQRGGLSAFAEERAQGATLNTRWQLRDLVVTGQTAIGRIVGTTTLERAGHPPAATDVNLRVRFERRESGWVITALVN